MLSSVYIDLGSITKPNILASSLLAYVPVFKKVSIVDVDYARLLFACAGVVDDDPGETYYNAENWIRVYERELKGQIQQAKTLQDPFASLRLLMEGQKAGYIEVIHADDSYLDGCLFLMPEELINATTGSELAKIPNLYKRWDVFIHILRPTIDQLTTKVSHTVKTTVTIRNDMLDSYIRGVGFATTRNFAVSTCNAVFWKWIKQNFDFRNEEKYSYTQLSRIVEASPQKFMIADVLEFIKKREIFENILKAKEEYDERLHTSDAKAREFLTFLIEEIVGTFAAPILTTVNFIKMIARWDFNKWRRMP